MTYLNHSRLNIHVGRRLSLDPHKFLWGTK
jgi:hypothetical protein